jgi:hypothetical protein
MTTACLVLNEFDYLSLWDDFFEILRKRIEELDEEESAVFIEDKDALEEWVKEQVIELFDAVLDDYNVEEAVVIYKGDCYYVPNSEEFFYLSYRKGKIDWVVYWLKYELKRSMKESVRRFRLK